MGPRHASGEKHFTDHIFLSTWPHAFVISIVGYAILLGFVNCTDIYDEQVSRQQAALSSIAYCKEARIENWDCATCQEFPGYVNVTALQGPRNARGFVALSIKESKQLKRKVSSPMVIEVAFAGTDVASIRNWMDDLEVFPVSHYYDRKRCRACKVHMGFLATYEALQDDVLSTVTRLLKQHPGVQVALTGHSLGGALAILCALDLKAKIRGVDLAPLYLFGAPRVGNGAFAQFTASQDFQIFRVIHNRDPVPHLPFMSWGFRHPPQEVLYDQAQNIHVVCSLETGEDATCSDRFPVAFDLMRMDDHTSYLGVDFSATYVHCALLV
ncbi:unnamed protein product [Choristocarpus tenellus]